MEHNNEQHPMTPSDKPVNSLDSQAPASLIPSVLSRLREEQASLSPETPVAQLVAALHDTSWSTRATAAFRLGELEEQTPIEPLIAALHDEDESVRQAAVRALGMLGERAPVDQLIAALHDANWSVRETAALTLGRLGKHVSVEPLLAIVNKADEDIFVREAAQWAIQQAHHEAIASMPSSTIVPPSIQTQQHSPTDQQFAQPNRHFPANLANFSKRWFGAHGGEERRETDDDIEMRLLPASNTRATSQHHTFTAPKRHIVQRIGQGVVAALLIAGIAVSWLAIAQRLHPSPGGHHVSTTPTVPILSHPQKGAILFTYRTTETVDYPIWSSDGKYMIFLTESNGNDSANVYVWNVTTRKLAKTLSFSHLPAQNWGWQSDGTNLFLYQAGELQIWNVITGQNVFTYNNPHLSSNNPNFTWSPDGKYIAVVFNNTTLQIWDVFTGQIRLTFPIDVPSPYTLLWSPDDTRIAVQGEHFEGISAGGIVGVYDTNTGSKISTIHDAPLIAVQWSPDGKYLLSEDLDLSTYVLTDGVWDARTGSKLSTHTPGSKAAYWLCDDQRLFAGTTQQNLQQILDIWDARTGKTIFMLHFTGQWQFSSDCKYIALYNQGAVQIADGVTGRTILTHHMSATVENVGFSNDNRYIASASKDNMLQVWNTVTGNILYTYHVASNTINIISWSPDDTLIATTSNDHIVQVLD